MGGKENTSAEHVVEKTKAQNFMCMYYSNKSAPQVHVHGDRLNINLSCLWICVLSV